MQIGSSGNYQHAQMQQKFGASPPLSHTPPRGRTLFTKGEETSIAERRVGSKIKETTRTPSTSSTISGKSDNFREGRSRSPSVNALIREAARRVFKNPTTAVDSLSQQIATNVNAKRPDKVPITAEHVYAVTNEAAEELGKMTLIDRRNFPLLEATKDLYQKIRSGSVSSSKRKREDNSEQLPTGKKSRKGQTKLFWLKSDPSSLTRIAKPTELNNRAHEFLKEVIDTSKRRKLGLAGENQKNLVRDAVACCNLENPELTPLTTTEALSLVKDIIEKGGRRNDNIAFETFVPAQPQQANRMIATNPTQAQMPGTSMYHQPYPTAQPTHRPVLSGFTDPSQVPQGYVYRDGYYHPN